MVLVFAGRAPPCRAVLGVVLGPELLVDRLGALDLEKVLRLAGNESKKEKVAGQRIKPGGRGCLGKTNGYASDPNS